MAHECMVFEAHSPCSQKIKMHYPRTFQEVSINSLLEVRLPKTTCWKVRVHVYLFKTQDLASFRGVPFEALWMARNRAFPEVEQRGLVPRLSRLPPRGDGPSSLAAGGSSI